MKFEVLKVKIIKISEARKKYRGHSGRTFEIEKCPWYENYVGETFEVYEDRVNGNSELVYVLVGQSKFIMKEDCLVIREFTKESIQKLRKAKEIILI